MSRETGWYRVRLYASGEWFIAKYENEADNSMIKGVNWWVPTYASPFSVEDLYEIDETPINPVPADDWISTKDSLPGMGTPILAIDIYKRNYQFPVSIYRTADPVSVFRWYDANDDSRFLWQVTHWKCIATETRVVEESEK